MELTTKQFEELWEVVHKTRKGSKKITVPKAHLENLLMDYAKLYDQVHNEFQDANLRWKRSP